MYVCVYVYMYVCMPSVAALTLFQKRGDYQMPSLSAFRGVLGQQVEILKAVLVAAILLHQHLMPQLHVMLIGGPHRPPCGQRWLRVPRRRRQPRWWSMWCSRTCLGFVRSFVGTDKVSKIALVIVIDNSFCPLLPARFSSISRRITR